jgi:curved DNA-binding protein
MQYKDYYAIMGLKRDAKPEEIKQAYRKLARKYHPDVSKEKDAEERFKEVNEAYEVLKDPEKRKQFDQLGANWREGQEFRPPPGWQQQQHNAQFDPNDFAAAGDFSDFFASLFGGGFQQRSHTRNAGFNQRGEDVHSKILITLEEAYSGTTRTLQLNVPQAAADGTMHMTKRELKVKIPAGITQGQQIRLSGQGNPGIGKGKAGDLYLEIDLQAHPLFHADKADVYLTLPIAPWEAALGATVPVPTLGGKVDLKIPANSQSGQKLRLKGRGLPAKQPGDQYIVLQVLAPPANTAAQRELYEQMAKQMAFNPREKLGV